MKKQRPENPEIAGFSQNRYHHRFQRKKLRRFLRSILFFDEIWPISWPFLLFYGNWLFSAPHFSSPDAHFKLQNHFTALFWTILHLPRLSLTQSKTPKKITIFSRPSDKIDPKSSREGHWGVFGRLLGRLWVAFGAWVVSWRLWVCLWIDFCRLWHAF